MKKLPVIIQTDIKNVEQSALDQINLAAMSPALKERIVIMPDVHAGAGCVIGFTGRFADSVICNLVGVDIGCGIAAHPIKMDIKSVAEQFPEIDAHIRKHIPLGFKHNPAHQQLLAFKTMEPQMIARVESMSTQYRDVVSKYGLKTAECYSQIGTLGGGNHFIELDATEDGAVYATVHTGSRNFGLKVANHFQNLAVQLTKELGIDVPKGLEALPMSFGGKEYIEAMTVAQNFAYYNRMTIMHTILEFFKQPFDINAYIDTPHNYISPRDHIIRKGAVSAYSDQKVVIPFNMADGIIIGKGKSNKDYNFSAPHGSGRTHGRKEMGRMLGDGRLSMAAFRDSMSGIYSTSIMESTIDESKFAYKPTESILERLKETVDIELRLKPIYNLKDDTKTTE
jgi:tRNA-splicing ligase RtcB